MVSLRFFTTLMFNLFHQTISLEKDPTDIHPYWNYHLILQKWSPQKKKLCYYRFRIHNHQVDNDVGRVQLQPSLIQADCRSGMSTSRSMKSRDWSKPLNLLNPLRRRLGSRFADAGPPFPPHRLANFKWHLPGTGSVQRNCYSSYSMSLSKIKVLLYIFGCAKGLADRGLSVCKIKVLVFSREL